MSKMMSRRTICHLNTFAPAGDQMLFRQGQYNYVVRLRRWFGNPAVVGTHRSNNIDFPLVRIAGDVLLGYNLYNYVVFIPRCTWRHLSSAAKASLKKQKLRWHCSSTEWKPGRGEVLLAGHEDLVNDLLRLGVLVAETSK